MVKLTHCCFEGALAFWSSSFGRLLLLLSQNIELGGFTRWCGAKLGFLVVLLHNSDIKIPIAICSKRKLLSSLLKQKEIYPCLWRCYICAIFFFKSWARWNKDSFYSNSFIYSMFCYIYKKSEVLSLKATTDESEDYDEFIGSLACHSSSFPFSPLFWPSTQKWVQRR